MAVQKPQNKLQRQRPGKGAKNKRALQKGKKRTEDRFMNEDNEIIRLSCIKCGKTKEGTYKKLFGDLPGLRCLPKMKCKCGGEICIELLNGH